MTDARESSHQLLHDRFPRSAKYHPEWIKNNSFGGPVLWLAEWLTESLDLKPGMRVLDLGCGRALSSVFLAREFGVEVWAADLWVSASENSCRLADAGVERQVFPLHCDARSLPFAAGFFDAIVCIDAYSYFGTDSLYLNYLAKFIKDLGQIGIAGAGIQQEFATVPSHLKGYWTQDFWCLHSAAWWRRLWEPTGIVAVETADALDDGWKVWLDWQTEAHPDNTAEIEALQADRGQNLGYIRMVGRKQPGIELQEYCFPDPLSTMIPAAYKAAPLLREA